MSKEKKWQVILNQYLRQKRLYCNFELKKTDTDSLPFKAIALHQIESLLAGQITGLLWKYSDQDQRKKPFDGSCNPPLPSYVIIKYPSCFVFISISKFIYQRDFGMTKSLTIDKAKEICDLQVIL